MGFLCLAYLASVFVAFSLCDMTGFWVSDWQNEIFFSCLPENFTILETSPPGNYNISYVFSLSDLSQNLNCKNANITQDFSSVLTQNSITGDWQDSLGQTLVYNDSTSTIMFTAHSGHLNLFSRNGTYISQIQGYGLIVGTWMNPTLVNSSAGQYCCAPSNITISQFSISAPTPNAAITYFYEPGACEGPNSAKDVSLLQLVTPDTISPIWTDMTMNYKVYFVYNSPIGQNKLAVDYESINGSYCNYYFEKFGTNLNGIWYSDWQNRQIDFTYVPYSFQIQTIDDIYMTINYNFSGVEKEDVIFEVSPNLYFDSSNMTNYTYYPDVNSFENLLISKLFTPTGSILNGSEFVGIWGNAQFPTGSSASSCCVPESISITNQTYIYSSFSLLANYSFGNNFSSSLCPGMTADELFEGSYTDYIEPYYPNPYSVTWDDFTGFRISFPNSSTTSEILVSFQESSGSCFFTMTRGYTPKSALSLSNSITILCILVFLLIIFS